MRTLIIPDIHEKIWQLEAILRQAGDVDQRVFTGDWFDRHPSQPGNFEATLQWLLDNNEDPKNKFLFGNHDVNYLGIGKSWAQCSGFSWQKDSHILPVRARLWKPFGLVYQVEGWTLSHAGFYKPGDIAEADVALEELRNHRPHRLLMAGFARGGSALQGGVTWQDWDAEFQPVAGLKQIVGHTTHDCPAQMGDNWALDCRLKYYGLIEDGEFKAVPLDFAEERVA